MSNYFADTSALAKRYLAEVGSRWVVSWIVPSANHVIVVSELVFVELRSLLERRVREKSLAASNAAVLKGNLLLHYGNEYLPCS